jgi:hypothetical protein
VAAEYGTLTDRGYLERVIASLGNRIFLMHNINEGKPRLFQSKWALSFLRGPLGREQIAELMRKVKEQDSLGAVVPTFLCMNCHAELPPGVADRCPSCGKNPWARVNGGAAPSAPVARVAQVVPGGAQGVPVALPAVPLAASAAPRPAPVAPPAAPAAGGARHGNVSTMPPVLPPDVNQFYLPVQKRPRSGVVEYRPKVLAIAEVVFVINKRTGQEYRTVVRRLAEPAAAGHPLDWERAAEVGVEPAAREANACWASVPEALDTGRKLKALEKAFGEFLYATQKLALLENRTLELISAPGESEGRFRDRCREAARREAEQALEMERVKFTPKFEALGVKVPEDPEEAKAGPSLLDRILSFGTAAAKKPAGPPRDKQEEKVRKLEADYQSKRNEVAEKWKRVGDEATPVQVKPRKADIRVTHFGLAWVPA